MTDAERASVRRYLGWSGRWRQTDDRLEGAMDTLESEAADEAIVVGLVGDCDEVMAQITANIANLAKTQGVGEVRLDGARTLATLRELGRTYSAQISNLLGVPIRSDAWGGGGASAFASADGQTGGNYLPQG